MAVPGVQEAIVFGVPDALMGEMLVAVLIPHKGAMLDEGMVRERLRANLSTYKIPKRIFIMPFGTVPRTVSAKVQRAELRRILVERLDAEGRAAAQA